MEKIVYFKKRATEERNEHREGRKEAGEDMEANTNKRSPVLLLTPPPLGNLFLTPKLYWNVPQIDS